MAIYRQQLCASIARVWAAMGSRADDPGKPPAHVVEMRTLGRLYCNRSAHVPPPGQHRGGAVAIGRQYVWRVPAPSLYRNLVAAALDVEPNTTMEAIAREVINFQMPGSSMPGFAENALTIAKAGIYDLRSHLNEVLRPVLRFWKVFDRKDFSDGGAALETISRSSSSWSNRRPPTTNSDVSSDRTLRPNSGADGPRLVGSGRGVVEGPLVSGGDHRALRVAVSPLPAELS